ncbi:MAG: hypothetical protein ABII90_14850, partial [Bacteroidota bacterium]
ASCCFRLLIRAKNNKFVENNYVMRIGNPLYYQAFKYLIENERIAKRIISFIIDQEVISLQLKQLVTTFSNM